MLQRNPTGYKTEDLFLNARHSSAQAGNYSQILYMWGESRYFSSELPESSPSGKIFDTTMKCHYRIGHGNSDPEDMGIWMNRHLIVEIVFEIVSFLTIDKL